MRSSLLTLFMALVVLALASPDQAGKSKANVPRTLRTVAKETPKANKKITLATITTPTPATKETPKPALATPPKDVREKGGKEIPQAAPTTPPKEIMIDDWIHHQERCRHCGAKVPNKKIPWYDSWIGLPGGKKGKKQN